MSRWSAIVVGLTAIIVYAAGLAPELTPHRDAAVDDVFQVTDAAWLQRAVVEWNADGHWAASRGVAAAWTHLPDGWNLNAASALLLMGAAALLASLGSSAVAAWAGLAIGLGFALSAAVWSAAIAAEGDLGPMVLTLAIIGTTVALRSWQTTRRSGWLWCAAVGVALATAEDAAIGLAAVAVIGIAAIHAGRRALLLLATIVAVVIAAQALALGQWLDRISTVPAVGVNQLVGAMWQWGVATDPSLTTVLGARLATLGSALPANIGWLGIALAAIGLQWSVRPLAAFMVAALALVLGPIPGVWDSESRVVPALAGSWWLVGLGLGRVASWSLAGGRPVAVVLAALVPALTALNTLGHASVNVDRAAGRMLADFVRQPPAPAAIVTDTAGLGRLLRWAGRRGMAAAGLDVVPHDRIDLAQRIERGETVIATEAAADRLWAAGFSGPPLTVSGRGLGDWLRSIDSRALVALAVTPGALDGDADARTAVSELLSGGGRESIGSEARVALVRQSPRLVHVRTDVRGATLVAGGANAGTDPSLIPDGGARIDVSEAGARIEVRGELLASVARGVIVATWSTLDGSLDWGVFEGAPRLATAWRHDRLAFSRLRHMAACTDLRGSAWHDMTTATTSARVGIEIPPQGQVRLYLAHARPLFVRGSGFGGRAAPVIRVTAWDRTQADQAAAAAAALAAAGIAAPEPTDAPYVWEVTAAASALEAALASIGLGGRPLWAVARVESLDAGAARVCEGLTGARLFVRPDRDEDAVSLADGDSFGAGWLGVTREGRERWRQTSEARSEVFVRIDEPAPLTVAISARALASVGGARTLEVNGTRPELTSSAGPAELTWFVPAHLWRRGTNRLVLSGPPATPLQVTAIRVRR